MDYLTRLIQRTVRTAPAVQPLLRSRYAPEDGGTLPPEDGPEEFVVESLPAAEPGIARLPRRTGPEAERPPVTVAEAPARGDSETVSATAVVSLQTAAVLQAGSVPAAPIGEMPPIPDQRVSPRVADPNEAPSRTPPESRDEDSPERLPFPQPGAPVEDPEDGLLLPQMPRGSDEKVYPASAAEPSRKVPTAESGEAEPPVVRVTIGRIDVRTAPPAKRPEPAPSPAPSPGPAPPRLGLDEYLRNGGRG